MDKFKEFYTQVMADDSVKAEVKKILGKTPVDEATDEQLLQLGELAKTLGLDISLKEAKAYLANEDDDEETCIRYVGATRAKDNLYWLRSRKS